MTRETDDLQRRQCNVCGEYWIDCGNTVCPFCHSENTEPMISDIDADESE
jgi:RNA polymerase subunit RPABC4/transcription elongation factor Spt4